MMNKLLDFVKKLSKSQLCGVGVTVVTVAVGIYVFKERRNRHKLHKTDFKKDVVYLYQFPSCRTIPCISPFAMKVETWLRLHKVPYESIRGTRNWSSKGQIPFVELNGRQIADSNLILAELTKHFNIDESKHLSPSEQGISRAISMMLDNQTVMAYFYYRYVEVPVQFVATWEFVGPIARRFITYTFPNAFGRRAWWHGIGRFTPSEIAEIGCNDFAAVSAILGDKSYLHGDHMTTSDCFLFSHLAQILCIPTVEYPQTQFVRQNCPNLVTYFERMKKELWSDWDSVCENYYMVQ